MGKLFGVEFNVIAMAVIAIVFLLVFGVPFATIAFFIAKNIKLVLIFVAILFIMNLLIKKK